MSGEASELLLVLDELDGDDAAISMVFDTSSEEEEDQQRSSRKGKSPNKKRDFLLAHSEVVRQYFNGTESIYSEADFERRFRVSRETFNTFMTA